MTLAELHGKLSETGSNVHERLEDLLTSDVFGPLRYLSDSRTVLALLAGAERVDWSRQYLRDLEAVRTLWTHEPAPQASVRFWPMLELSEPDVLYEWVSSDSRRFFLMIEVKYLSGPSDSDPKWVDEATPSISMQLDREYEDLRRLISRHPQSRGALVYLTGHNSRPRDAIAESLHRGFTAEKVDVYWTNWSGVHREVCRFLEAADGGAETLWCDIRDLLERKGFSGVRAWNVVLPISDRSLPDGMLYCYKVAPIDTRYDWGVWAPKDIRFFRPMLFQEGAATSAWSEIIAVTGEVRFYGGSSRSYDWAVPSKPHDYTYRVAAKE